ncbi:MAG: DUF2158 domain-containing protein [Alphaproteobacteria bacterium]|jgi:uncharacterized protein YodC (DUF2158 family)|nr:DUF2158 domain-containing protein [Alphaproteobacteria bacterium]
MNTQEEFKVGDIVYLKSGSPAMVVLNVFEGAATMNVVDCIYFNPSNGEITHKDITPFALTKIKPNL